MLRTRIPTPRVVDMVDQAMLYLGQGATAQFHDLRRLGVCTATDLMVVEQSTPPGAPRRGFHACA